jgi:tRNA (cytidine/uridine-2'-O-)-methyltransferase
MFSIVLVAPEIPQNTGNIGRLCVNTDSRLVLIRPLGFDLDEASVRRAGLDYWPYLNLAVYDSWDQFIAAEKPTRLVFASTKGKRSLYEVQFSGDDFLVFGRETSGLPPALYHDYAEHLCRIPMPGSHARSLNLANAVAVVIYEALRQTRCW